MKKSIVEVSPEQLVALLKDRDSTKRLRAVEAVAKKPTAEHIPGLSAALADDWEAVAKTAATAMRKLGPRAIAAVDDLISAASAPWKFGCPQLFCDSMEALVKISPEDPRLVPIIQGALKCSNYGIQKAAVMSLVRIGSKEAIETLQNVDKHWMTAPITPQFRSMFTKVLDSLAASNADWTGHERLRKWLNAAA